MHETQRIRFRDDTAVAVATAIPKHDNITRQGRFDLSATIKNKAQVTLFTTMQMPIGFIWTGIKRLANFRINKGTNDQHSTIDARAFYIGGMMIRRAKPLTSRCNDSTPLIYLGH